MDLNFINAPQNLSSQSEKEFYKISDDQKVIIENSRMEIKNGKFHKNEDVILEMREWLKNNLAS